MHISELKIWNFRKYDEIKPEEAPELSGYPGLWLNFNPHFNILVGENDSGKTTIIDAIKLILLTQSREYIRMTREDFYQSEDGNEQSRSNLFKIQCIFRDLSPEEASHFIEWLGVEKNSNGDDAFFLKVMMTAKRRGNSVYPETKAGPDEEGSPFFGEARDYLRLIYLKPLRDAENELTPSRNSRLSQILDNHKSFREKEDHPLVDIANEANRGIATFFDGKKPDGTDHPNLSGKELVGQINDYLENFFGEDKKARFSITDAHLKGILEKLSLKLASNKAGLGSHNLLFIAAELLLLEREDYTGLKLALIEEIEAHLHPQAQLRLIKFLQELTEDHKIKFQLILTSHSPNLASEVKLDNLIILNGSKAFPMGSDYTKLNKGDYLFLERFLDVTKANLFFAKGIIMVEGDAEALLIPAIAEIIDCSLVKYGVSIVNVGSTAFKRYANIFKRKDLKKTGPLDINVAVVTDADVIPIEGQGRYKNSLIDSIGKDLGEERERIKNRYDGQRVKTFVSRYWTLEYDLACSKLRKLFYRALLHAIYIKNSDKIGLTDKKKGKARKNVKEHFAIWEAKWNGDKRKKRKIAFRIYNDIMLKKSGLKAIAAQCFAEILISKAKKGADKKAKLKEIFETDEHIKYLTDAIKYAANIQ